MEGCSCHILLIDFVTAGFVNVWPLRTNQEELGVSGYRGRLVRNWSIYKGVISPVPGLGPSSDLPVPQNGPQVFYNFFCPEQNAGVDASKASKTEEEENEQDIPLIKYKVLSH